MTFNIKRIMRLFLMISVVSGLILGRLFYLQILEANKLSLRAIESRMIEVPSISVRGDILDRKGLPLTGVANQSYLFIFPDQVISKQLVRNKLFTLGLDNRELFATLMAAKKPFKWKQPISSSLAEQINSANLTGVIAIREKKRYNPDGLAAHILGYINAADNKGVSGLEETYDTVLSAQQTDAVAVMVDATQQVIPGLGYKRINMGDQATGSIVLTIDRQIQRIVESVLDQGVSKGTVIIMEPATGEIVAMASRPNFDADQLTIYLNQQEAPLLNRAVRNYAPGSVFKLVVSAAALEQNLVKPGEVFYDQGYIDVNSVRFRSWDHELGPRGKLNFTEALAYSSNPVFIELGLRLGAEKLLMYAQRFGFGRPYGIGLQEEAAGNLPDPTTVYAADLANLSIGQGTLEATPLQVLNMVAAIANDGVLRQPLLVKRIIQADGSSTVLPVERSPEQVISRATAKKLQDMMRAATSYGTGAGAQVARVGAAGKTGSAETGRFIDGKSINHAWFVGFAPAKQPRYAAVIFIEDGRSGGNVAAPLFKQIMERVLAIEQ